MKIKCPACGCENYFSGLEDEETRFCSDCNEPLFKIRKDFKQDYLFKIIKNSTMAVEVIRRLVEKKGTNQNKYNLTDTEWSLILFEFIYFYLHLTDRFAFGHMNDEQREILMIDLGELCITAAVDADFLKWPEDKKKKNETPRSRATRYLFTSKASKFAYCIIFIFFFDLFSHLLIAAELRGIEP